MNKTNKKIELYVDENLHVENNFPRGSLQVTVSNITGGLFLGGIPSSLNDTDISNQYIASTIPLRGAIKELVFDRE